MFEDKNPLNTASLIVTSSPTSEIILLSDLLNKMKRSLSNPFFLVSNLNSFIFMLSVIESITSVLVWSSILNL
ncbi:MAG TPA: hypothetical protein VNR61_11015 [Niallia sp.]|nr:hypothetical protein [Niallia sp.]